MYDSEKAYCSGMSFCRENCNRFSGGLYHAIAVGRLSSCQNNSKG